MNNHLVSKTLQRMTVKEISAALNVSADLVKKRIKELYPNKMENGKTTYLNEVEVTAVKLRIKENSSLATYDDRNRLSNMPKTQLEKNLLIQQAFNLLKEEEQSLRIELTAAKEQLQIQSPKVEFFDTVTKSDSWLTFKEVANMLAIPELGRNNLMKRLREIGYLTQYNKPYQKHIGQKLFKVIESETSTGRVNISTVVSQKGLDRLIKVLK